MVVARVFLFFILPVLVFPGMNSTCAFALPFGLPFVINVFYTL